MGFYDPKTARCECCGQEAFLVPTAFCCQRTGHNWSSSVCEWCEKHCTDDGEGRAVHVPPSLQDYWEVVQSLSPEDEEGELLAHELWVRLTPAQQAEARQRY